LSEISNLGPLQRLREAAVSRIGDLVAAAQAGDRRARDEFVRA
jgi:hypothetical protein